ncbi:hypothetical protein BsWGS_12143 [Bradybaena similaris]
MQNREAFEREKMKLKEEMPRHKKYQGLIKSYTKEDEIASWLRNLESILNDERIPKCDWAFILRKCLTGEPLKVIESVEDDMLNSYEYLKQLLQQHFNITEMGQRDRYKSLAPKANQTFQDYVAEIKMTLDNWLKAASVESFSELKDLFVKDKLLTSVPHRLATFLIEQGVESFDNMLKKGTSYCQANKDIFSSGLTADLNIGAAASYQGKHRFSKSRRKEVGFTSFKNKKPWRGNFSECRFCHATHGENEMCEENPEYKKFLSKHMKVVAMRNSKYTPRKKCWCCHAVGHISTICQCRQAKQLANLSYGKESDNSFESYETSDSETMHDDTPRVNACKVVGIDDIQKCDVCKNFHENAELVCGHKVPVTIADANELQGMSGSLKVVPGFVNSARVHVLRDTGSTLIGVNKALVKPKDYTGEHVICRTFGGEQQRYPIAWVKVVTPFLTGRVKSAVLLCPCTELIVGNVPNVQDVNNDDLERWKNENMTSDNTSNAVTRQQTARLKAESEQSKVTIVPIQPKVQHSHDTIPQHECQIDKESQSKQNVVEPTTDTLTLPQQQKEDKTLVKCWDMVDKPEKHTKHSTTKFVVLKNILHRLHQTGLQTTKQIVLPIQHRPKVLDLAHSSAFGGHMGVQKTLSRIEQHYYWPGVNSDAKSKCQSCVQCQTTRPEGKFPKAHLQTTDVPSRPFEKVAIEIIGPMRVASDKGNMYVLTFVDLCTRWPEAIPLRSITSEAIAEALLLIFSRVGFPNTILSDNGPQFFSQATRLVLNKLGIKQVFATPYHPQTNGTCERFNGTLKAMLGKVAYDNPTCWDVMLPSILFAFREIPHESTKFSPFELVYGANPRGPLSIYKDLLTKADMDIESKSAYDLVTSVRERVLTGCELANKFTHVSHAVNRGYKNVNKKTVSFVKGDLVMLLLPKKNQKLLVEWQGPYRVLDKVSDVDYRIEVDGKPKLFHVNMIVKYYEQKVVKTELTNSVIVLHSEDQRLTQEHKTERHDQIQDANTLVSDCNDQEGILDIIEPVTKSKTSYKDVKIGPTVTSDQKKQIVTILKKYSMILSDVPGQSKSVMHHIKVTTDVPIKVKPYIIPEHYKEKVESEIRELEKLNVIQRSNSNYASSMVVIRKKDESIRICIDYRKLNQITITDAEPIPGADDLLSSVARASWFTKLDMTKGYYQIPLTPESKHLTAFSTSLGLIEFNFMPFGLVNAPATFVRMTRALLRGVPNVLTYIDDMCIFTETFDEHLVIMTKVFDRLRDNGLTIKPVKVEIAFKEISFLGHAIKHGIIATDDTIVSKILNIQPPKTRKHVQALLGLINYYAKFVPCFAEKTAILSSLLKKENKKIVWSEKCQNILDEVKKLFSSSPILRTPDYKETFVIQTDASHVAISGCLGQYFQGILHPCYYVSRKLSSAEKNYSTVELEALAVIFTVTKFQKFLLGKPFIIQSDNQPLRVITSGIPKNSRIARWALILQDFKFTVSHIEGNRNCLADLLSRL